jgi:hypothetical protein
LFLIIMIIISIEVVVVVVVVVGQHTESASFRQLKILVLVQFKNIGAQNKRLPRVSPHAGHNATQVATRGSK